MDVNNLKQAIIMGIVVTIVGNIVGFLVGKSLAVPLPKVCKSWNKNYVMEICLFLTGVIIYYGYKFKNRL